MSSAKRQIDEIVPLVLVQNDEYFLPYALKCIEGSFGRIVIYNVGSTDSTPQIIDEFKERNSKDTDVLVRHLPDCPPDVQLCFRNSMIADARSDFYYILDGDEVYDERSVQNIQDSYATMQREYEFEGKIYGVVRRIEILDDLTMAHGVGRYLPHHRVYHRVAIWSGSHPGERPYYLQHKSSEVVLEGITCFHFHNCQRTRPGNTAQGRDRRKNQATYKRGEATAFDVWNHLPILHKKLWPYTHPGLEKLQNERDSI